VINQKAANVRRMKPSWGKVLFGQKHYNRRSPFEAKGLAKWAGGSDRTVARVHYEFVISTA
jgi:hypothetical protein